MDWVKNIVGMNYYWLISNCSSLFLFRFSLLFAFTLSLSLLYLSLCGCLVSYLFSSLYFEFFSKKISLSLSCFVFSCILFFIVFMTLFVFLCVFQYSLFWFFYCWKWCTPVPRQSSIQVRPAIHLLRPFLSFSIYPPSFFSSCFLFWHGYSAIRTNDLIELGWYLWGFVLFVDKTYEFSMSCHSLT